MPSHMVSVPCNSIVRPSPLCRMTPRASNNLMFIRYLLLTFVLLTVTPLTTGSSSFRQDCSDQGIKEIACSVRAVDCDDESIARIDESVEMPESAHDIRVEPFSRALTRRAQHKYQLLVDISWQMPPLNSTSQLKAFLLEMSTVDGALNRSRSCYLLNVSDSQWTNELINSSPRFRFSTESVFQFGLSYDIDLTSLPRSNSSQNTVFKHVSMPQHPELNKTATDAPFDCTKHSNTQAAKFAAAFRRIFVHSLARTIQVEFVGAPPHYCFEAYEVRLKDETGLDLLYSSIIPVSDMRVDVIDNTTILYGEFNFTDLELERDYIPSVIPIERTSDGRCVCPVNGIDPYDSRVVCSCLAADWKKVRLPRLERPTAPPMVPELNVTVIETEPQKNKDGIWALVMLSLLMVAMLVLLVIVYVLYMYYQRYRATDKTVHLRLVSNRSTQPDSRNGSANTHAPLIHTSRPNILLVYSHDCAAHDAVVVALAEYLRDVFSFDVHMDVWESEEIERNLMDYISASIVNADKVLVVNSMGSHFRYHNKIQHEAVVERIQHTMHDSLFESQIDQALMHPSTISVRFSYTPYSMVIPPLGFSLQYVLPDNVAPLLSNLCDCNMKNDARLIAYNEAQVKLTAAVARMNALVTSDPEWFHKTHHRIPRVSSILPKLTALDNGYIPLANGKPHNEPICVSAIDNQSVDSSSAISSDLRSDHHDVDLDAHGDIRKLIPLVSTAHCDTSALHTDEGVHSGTMAPSLPQPSTSEERLSLEEDVDRVHLKLADQKSEPEETSVSDTLDSGLMVSVTPLLSDALEMNGKLSSVTGNESPPVIKNGHTNGMVGRPVKNMMSSQQNDSGLIADMRSIDVSS